MKYVVYGMGEDLTIDIYCRVEEKSILETCNTLLGYKDPLCTVHDQQKSAESGHPYPRNLIGYLLHGSKIDDSRLSILRAQLDDMPSPDALQELIIQSAIKNVAEAKAASAWWEDRFGSKIPNSSMSTSNALTPLSTPLPPLTPILEGLSCDSAMQRNP